MAAYTGSSLDSLVPVSQLPLSNGAYSNAVSFDAVEGETYQIAVDGNLGTSGNLVLHVSLTKPAVNDSFERRIQLHGIYILATSYNAGATHQAAEPAVAAGSNGKTVWWSWKAPVSGPVALDLFGSEYSFPIAVFTGSKLANLQMVASGSGGVFFNAVEGQSYQIAVSDDSGRAGAIQLKLQAPVVEVPLTRTFSTRNKAVLHYSASLGQMILLLRSNDGWHWQNVATALARRASVEFLVRPPPASEGPFYRAIVVDRAF
jgi:hypothetical protein